MSSAGDPLSAEVTALLNRTDSLLSQASSGRALSDNGRVSSIGSRGLLRSTSTRSHVAGAATDALSEAASRLRSSLDTTSQKLGILKKAASFKEPLATALSIRIPSDSFSAADGDAPTPRLDSPVARAATPSVAFTDRSGAILERSISTALTSPGRGRTYNSFEGLQDIVSAVDDMVSFGGAGSPRGASDSLDRPSSVPGLGLGGKGSFRAGSVGLRPPSRLGPSSSSPAVSPRSLLRFSSAKLSPGTARPVPPPSPGSGAKGSRRAQLQALLSKDLAAPYEVVKFKSEVESPRSPAHVAEMQSELQEKFDRVNRKLKNWQFIETAAVERFNNAMDAALDTVFARVNLSWPASKGAGPSDATKEQKMKQRYASETGHSAGPRQARPSSRTSRKQQERPERRSTSALSSESPSSSHEGERWDGPEAASDPEASEHDDLGAGDSSNEASSAESEHDVGGRDKKHSRSSKSQGKTERAASSGRSKSRGGVVTGSDGAHGHHRSSRRPRAVPSPSQQGAPHMPRPGAGLPLPPMPQPDFAQQHHMQPGHSWGLQPNGMGPAPGSYSFSQQASMQGPPAGHVPSHQHYVGSYSGGLTAAQVPSGSVQPPPYASAHGGGSSGYSNHTPWSSSPLRSAPSSGHQHGQSQQGYPPMPLGHGNGMPRNPLQSNAASAYEAEALRSSFNRGPPPSRDPALGPFPYPGLSMEAAGGFGPATEAVAYILPARSHIEQRPPVGQSSEAAPYLSMSSYAAAAPLPPSPVMQHAFMHQGHFPQGYGIVHSVPSPQSPTYHQTADCASMNYATQSQWRGSSGAQMHQHPRGVMEKSGNPDGLGNGPTWPGHTWAPSSRTTPYDTHQQAAAGVTYSQHLRYAAMGR